MGVETAMAATSLGSTVVTTGLSFLQAGEQRSKQRQAEAAAEKAMKAARDRLSINYTDKMAVKKEPYELQREALLSQGAMAIQAGVESERGAAATAGKTQMAMNEAQAGIRTEMGKEMTEIERQQIEEESRLRDLNAQLDLEQAAGAQLAAQNAEEAAASATMQGVQGGISAVQQGISMIPLFKNKGDNDFQNKAVVPDSMISSGTVPFTMPSISSSQPPRIPVSNSSLYGGYFPQPLRTGNQYGMFGTDFSGVGGYYNQ
jgi:hypothetical protein